MLFWHYYQKYFICINYGITMLETSLLVITVATLAMLSPGPDFFMIIKNAARYHYNAAMMTALGITLGIVTHMIYCVAGLAVVIAAIPQLFNLIKYAGALYLIWIGYQALRSNSNHQAHFSKNEKQQISLKKAFFQGYLCNLLNPKATLFFLALFTQILAPDSSILEKLWYASIIIILSAIWWPLLVYLVQHPRVQSKLNKAQSAIDKLLGGLLIVLGIKVAISS